NWGSGGLSYRDKIAVGLDLALGAGVGTGGHPCWFPFWRRCHTCFCGISHRSLRLALPFPDFRDPRPDLGGNLVLVLPRHSCRAPRRQQGRTNSYRKCFGNLWPALTANTLG